jgi:hypothetical protein
LRKWRWRRATHRQLYVPYQCPPGVGMQVDCPANQADSRRSQLVSYKTILISK